MTAVLESPAGREFAEVADRYAAAHFSPDNLRQLRSGALSAAELGARWRAAATLGWASMTLPESCGGAAAGITDLASVASVLGRRLGTAPLVTATLAGEILAHAGGSETEALLRRVGDGEYVIIPALAELWPGDGVGRTSVTVRPAGGGYTLTGRLERVPDAPLADALLVTAELDGGRAAFLVDSSAPGVRLRSGRLVDSRPVATVELTAVRASLVFTDVTAAVDASVLRATALAAAELLGIAEETFERTVTYLKQRTQFGVPIGAFQSLQHRAADLWCELAMARSVLRQACAALDTDQPDALDLVRVAKAKVSEVTLRICEDAIQMHGGIGMCDECDIGLFLKRARVGEQLFGDARYHRDRYAVEHGY